MSKSGVTGTILQVVGAIVTFAGAPYIGMAIMAAGSYQSGQYQRRKSIDQYNASLTDRTVMTATYNAARSRIYGRARNVDGVIFHKSYGDKKQFYTLVVAFAGCQVDEFEQIYFNDVPVTIEPGTGNVLTAPYLRYDRKTAHEGGVISGANTLTLAETPYGTPYIYYSDGYRTRVVPVVSVAGKVVTVDAGHAGRTIQVSYTVETATSYAKIKLYKGSSSQDISSELMARFPDLITPDDKFGCIALAIVDLEYSEDAYPSGVPSISAVMRGVPVYDPRTSTTAWSENPALCVRDWSLYAHGGDCRTDELHEASIAQAANDCDISHTYTDSNAVSTTRALYTCAYAAKLDISPESHLSEMVEAMGGRWGWAGGQLKVRAGVYHAPVIDLDDSFLSDKGAARTIIAGPGMEDLVNTYKITIADSSQNHMATELPALQPSAYLAADGTELAAEVQMGAVTFAPQALHIAGTLLRDQRQGLTVTWPCNMKAWPIELFDIVSVTCARYGWTGKQFEVMKTSQTPNGVVELTMKETGSSIWNPDTVFSAVDQEPNTSLPSVFDVPDVSGLDAQSGTSELQVMSDGTIISRFKFTWSPVSRQSVIASGYIEVGYTMAGSDQELIIRAPGTDSSVQSGAVVDGQPYLIRARACTSLVRGRWSAAIVRTAIGKREKPPTVDAFTITTQPDGTRLLQGGYLPTTRPADHAGYRIRFRQGAGPFDWESMTPFQNETGFFTALPIETNQLLAGTYTLAIVGVDTTLNESETPLQIIATLPNPRLGSALQFYIYETLGWPGTLTNCQVSTESGASVIRATDQATWATIPATWAAFTRWVWDPYSTITYSPTAADFGAVVQVLPVVSVACVGTSLTEEQHSSDGSTWSSWATLASPFNARYVRLRITVTATGTVSPGVTQICSISSVSVIYTGKVTSETGNDISPAALSGGNRIGVGDIRLPLTRTYASISRVSLALQSVTGNWSWALVDKATTGPRIQFYNASGVLADPPLIDFTVEGIAS